MKIIIDTAIESTFSGACKEKIPEGSIYLANFGLCLKYFACRVQIFFLEFMINDLKLFVIIFYLNPVKSSKSEFKIIRFGTLA